MIRAYLDNNATTRAAPGVIRAMAPHFDQLYLNPSSAAGVLMGVDKVFSGARRALARLAGDANLADSFVLTSGASEANSWAIAGAVGGARSGHLVTTAIEHPSVLAAMRAANGRGMELKIGTAS